MSPPASFVLSAPFNPITRGLAWYARQVLICADPSEKVRLTHEAAAAWTRDPQIGPSCSPPPHPSRPSHPRIVSPGQMPSVKDADAPSNVYHLHGLAHVELNAIDLCFDTMLRFAPGLKNALETHDWYADWIRIAADEARHFEMLQKRLRGLGAAYGDLPAHGIVWASAEVSQGCRKERLALGQLVAEAKGLDAGPRLADRLVGAGDNESAAIVRLIAEEELEHVRIGVKWFVRECEEEGVEPVAAFHEIAMRLSNPGAFTPPFNEEKRREAGMEPEWYLPVAEQMKAQVLTRRRERKAAAAGAQG